MMNLTLYSKRLRHAKRPDKNNVNSGDGYYFIKFVNIRPSRNDKLKVPLHLILWILISNFLDHNQVHEVPLGLSSLP